MQVGRHHRQQHPVRFVHAAGRRDYVVLRQVRDHVARRHVMLQHQRRIQPHHELAILAADHADAVGTVDSMQTWDQVVVHDVGQFRQAAYLRTETQIDDRKRAGSQQDRVDRRIVGQLRTGVRDRGAQRLESDLRVGVFPKGDVNLGAAARRRRSNHRHPDHAVSGFLQRPRDRREHLLGWQVAAVGENRRAAKRYLGEHRAGNCPGQYYAEHAGCQHRQHGERRSAARHWVPCATRTPSPSDRA